MDKWLWDSVGLLLGRAMFHRVARESRCGKKSETADATDEAAGHHECGDGQSEKALVKLLLHHPCRRVISLVMNWAPEEVVIWKVRCYRAITAVLEMNERRQGSTHVGFFTKRQGARAAFTESAGQRKYKGSS